MNLRVPHMADLFPNTAPLWRESRWVWLVLCIFSLLGLADVAYAHFLELPHSLGEALVFFAAIFKGTAIYFLLGLSRGRPWLHIAVWFFAALYILLCAVNGIGYLVYRIPVSSKMVRLIGQTNLNECTELSGDLLHRLWQLCSTWKFWKVMISACGLAIGFKNLSFKLFKLWASVFAALGLVGLLIVLPTLKEGRNCFFMSIRIPKIVVETVKSERKFRRYAEVRREFPNPDGVKSKRLAPDVVLVVGESAAKWNLSAYGCPLPTTPRLDALSDSLFIFNNAVAAGLYTEEVMETLLTFKSDLPSEREWHEYPSLPGLMENAGYKTFWLSNQERTGMWSNATGAIVEVCDSVVYVGSDNDYDKTMTVYDEALLPPLRKALADAAPAKFIGLHLMGSHVQFASRYPRGRNRFRASDVENELPRPWLTDAKAKEMAQYANSLSYTDSIVGEVIALAKMNQKPEVVVILSDHGQEVYYNEDTSGRTRRVAEVPFIVFCNAAYLRQNPEMERKLRRATGRRFSTSALPHILMTLTGTEYPYYKGVDDPLSDEFRNRTLYVEETPYGS